MKGPCERCGKCRKVLHCTWITDPKGADLCRSCWQVIKSSIKKAYDIAVERQFIKIKEEQLANADSRI